MRVLLAIAATVLCWGIYGPVLHLGQNAMEHSRLRPFICVGLAYFLIAVLAPAVLFYYKGEKGHWTLSGILWSLAAGAAGAIGALGIIIAFAMNGRPVFVMPLVFGGAPVVNTLMTAYMTKTFKQIGPVFIAGLILVILGSVTVLVTRPGPSTEDVPGMTPSQFALVLLSVATTILCWGVYGPLLHRGQMNMAGSRLRPFMGVGFAYFLIAVFVPGMILSAAGEPGQWTVTGTVWSTVAGAAGAVGALGVIMAFDFGGKPIYVMPLIFGGAPVVNTVVTMITKRIAAPTPLFYAGLIILVAGAVVVLVFAPKGEPPKPSKGQPAKPDTDRQAPATDEAVS